MQILRQALPIMSFETITADYTVTPADDVITVDATAGNVTITLPPPSTFTNSNMPLYIKKIDASANSVTINGNIDGSLSVILSTLNQGTVLFPTPDKYLSLVGSAGGGGGGGTWGSITGVMSNQTDLQSALDSKAPTSSPTFVGNVTLSTGDVLDGSGLGSEAALLFRDVTTGNSSAAAHGLLPKLSGFTTQYLNGNGSWTVVDHASLSNLGIGDPHSQYLYSAGRGSGQQLYGGLDAGGNLGLVSTLSATKGKILLGTAATSFFDEAANNFVAYLKPLPNTTAPGTAPIKLTNGTLMSALEQGAIEYAGDRLYFNLNGSVRVFFSFESAIFTESPPGGGSVATINFFNTPHTRKYVYTLAGNVTVGNPINIIAGSRLYVSFISQGAGNVITFGTAFKTSSIPTPTGAGQKAAMLFFYDGTHWVQTGGPLVWL